VLLSLLASVAAFAAAYDDSRLSVVSVVDPNSMHVCLIKLHSIIESTGSLSNSIHSIENLRNSSHKLNRKRILSVFQIPPIQSINCNLGAAGTELFRGKTSCLWLPLPLSQRSSLRPASLFNKVLRGDHKFSSALIFARFYLPHIFNETRRMVYLDNDLVVTADITKLLYTPMTTHGKQGYPAPVSLVFEKAIFYKFYVHTHFDGNHSLVRAAQRLHGEKFFMNAGVILFDNALWIKQGLTSLIEKLLIENADEYETTGRPIFDAQASRGYSIC
jgi:lipopolysaccharide biosynthesis glycosyltransferase